MTDLHEEARRHAARERRQPFVNGVLTVGLLALAAGLGVAFWQLHEARADRSDALSSTQAVGQAVVRSPVCQSDDPLDQARFAELCRIGQDVAARPDAADPDALADAITSAVAAGLQQRVEAAVAAHLAAHPPRDGKTPTPEELTPVIATAVAGHLQANPPPSGPPGPPPAATDLAPVVAAEVAAYLERHPPPPGPRGEPGRAPTPEEIDAAVARWFEVHPPNGCPGTWEHTLFLDGRSGYRCLVPTTMPTE